MDGLLTEERAYNKSNVGIMKGDIGKKYSSFVHRFYLIISSSAFTW